MPCHEPVSVIFDTYCVFHSQAPSELKLEPMIVCINMIKFISFTLIYK